MSWPMVQIALVNYIFYLLCKRKLMRFAHWADNVQLKRMPQHYAVLIVS